MFEKCIAQLPFGRKIKSRISSRPHSRQPQPGHLTTLAPTQSTVFNTQNQCRDYIIITQERVIALPVWQKWPPLQFCVRRLNTSDLGKLQKIITIIITILRLARRPPLHPIFHFSSTQNGVDGRLSAVSGRSNAGVLQSDLISDRSPLR